MRYIEPVVVRTAPKLYCHSVSSEITRKLGFSSIRFTVRRKLYLWAHVSIYPLSMTLELAAFSLLYGAISTVHGKARLFHRGRKNNR